MDQATSRRHDAALDRVARQLVPERELVVDRGKQPAREALFDFGDRRSGDAGQQVEIDARAEHGGGFEHRPRGRREPRRPRQNCVPHGRRHAVSAEGEHLGDVERVAAGALEQLDGIEPARRGQCAHRLGGQRAERNPVDARIGREVAQQTQERMRGAELVVAEGDDDQEAAVVEVAGVEAEHADARLVGPMRVFADDDRHRVRIERVHHRAVDAVEP